MEEGMETRARAREGLAASSFPLPTTTASETLGTDSVTMATPMVSRGRGRGIIAGVLAGSIVTPPSSTHIPRLMTPVTPRPHAPTVRMHLPRMDYGYEDSLQYSPGASDTHLDREHFRFPQPSHRPSSEITALLSVLMENRKRDSEERDRREATLRQQMKE
ncbi:hypothetical protein ACOMHN_016335 [Nucella lapillus]